MALRRVRLERSWCRLTRELADHSSRGIHRCDRIVFRNCLRQCHRGHDSVPFVSRGANASNATALGPELHDVGNCRPASIRLADRSKPFANKIASRRRHSFPLFAAVAGKWVPGDFDAGKDYTLVRLTSGDVQIAPLICFEDTIGDLTRQFVLHGANLLANVTNDGWFLHSAGSEQHLANSVFRCVETRRPMVRAANTGVTCFVNEFGRVTQVLQDETGSTFTEGVLTGDVDIPIARELTFYSRHGELFAQLCACVTLVVIAVRIALRQSRRGGSPEPPASRTNTHAAGD